MAGFLSTKSRHTLASSSLHTSVIVVVRRCPFFDHCGFGFAVAALAHPGRGDCELRSPISATGLIFGTITVTATARTDRPRWTWANTPDWEYRPYFVPTHLIECNFKIETYEPSKVRQRNRGGEPGSNSFYKERVLFIPGFNK